ncbi:hypothetical protein CI109_104447 [Kwoniella shandongensis]|uniref:AB hydrolase-1 domain-containing protein n=1 Tax=Kwoniella shandongensis TaxID=1734106 RepID=A0A5M6BQX7_9TREE|nr:uncharacterized protein CI109_007298 [Kwoniella shandongensis]KAA5524350.1 hypothetical protein CI109_007298 [Kwoniella shandongensis]
MASVTKVPLSYIEINGARLAYRISGREDLPLLIDFHGGRGFGSHGKGFQSAFPLTDIVRLLAFDFRGHGQSSSTRPYTFAQIVDDIEALRKHFAGDRKVIISGGSFGGFIAQQYALTYPDSLSHLILRGTAPSHHHEEQALATLRERAPSRAPMASENMLKKVFGAFKDDNEFRLIIYSILPLYTEGEWDRDAVLESARNIIFNAESHNSLYSEEEKYFDYRDRLKEIEVPTLIIVGEKDWITPPTQSKIIHEGIKNSKLHIFPNANHSVQSEKHAEVIALIRRFLSEK